MQGRRHSISTWLYVEYHMAYGLSFPVYFKLSSKSLKSMQDRIRLCWQKGFSVFENVGYDEDITVSRNNPANLEPVGGV